MNQKLLKMAEALGIDTNNKTDTELMSAIDQYWVKEKSTIEDTSRQVIIDNGVNLFPELKKQLEKPFEIWLEKVGQGKKPECLPVVGYNQKTSEVIVCKEGKSDTGKTVLKLYSVDEKLIITSLNKLDEINDKIKADKKAALARAKAEKDANSEPKTAKPKKMK